MSFFDHEKTAHRVAAQYLTGAVERQAAFSMDMFARLSILEGAAGVPPGKWLRKGARGFGDALEHFGSHLAAAWTTTRNEGVYDKALAAASRILGSTAMDPPDLVQDLVVNSTTTTGPDRSRMFYTVGKKLSSHANDLGSGKILPRDSKILGTLERWVRRAGIDKLKELKNRATTSFAPNTPEGFDPTRTMSVTDLDAEKRQGLLLLALQSPGGPGQELRRIIDRLVDQSFGKVARPIVRVFLQKIGEPKYRSATSMRRLLTEFKPSKWMKQAVNLVRKEMMAEMGVDSNTLTRVLGASGRNIFKFMREKVGRNSTVQRILTELAQEIDLLEPGISRVADEREYELTEDQTPLEPHEVMVEWVRQSEQDSDEDEKEGGHSLPNQHGGPDLLGDIFEMNEYMDWDTGTGSQGIYTRGPVELRVARRYLVAEVPEEYRGQRFRSPESGNQVLFQSLPKPEQERLRAMLQREQGDEEVQVPGRQEHGLKDKLKRHMAPTPQSVRSLRSEGQEALSGASSTISRAKRKLETDAKKFVEPAQMQENLDKVVRNTAKLEKVRESPSFRKLDDKLKGEIKTQIDDGHKVINDLLNYRPGKGLGPKEKKFPTSYKPPSKKDKGSWRKRFPKIEKAFKELSDNSLESEFFGKSFPRKDDGKLDYGAIYDEKKWKPDPSMGKHDYLALKEQIDEVRTEARELIKTPMGKLRTTAWGKKKKDQIEEQDSKLYTMSGMLERLAEKAKERGPREPTEGEARWKKHQENEREEGRRNRGEREDIRQREELADMSHKDFNKFLDNVFAPESKRQYYESLREQGKRERSKYPGASRDQHPPSRRAAKDLPKNTKFLQWVMDRKFTDPETDKKTNFMGLSPKGRAEARKEFDNGGQKKKQGPEKKKPAKGGKPGWRDRLQDLGDKQGTVELRVARRFLLAGDVPDELKTQRFPNPNPRGRMKDVLFTSLPPEEQQRILMRYKQQQKLLTEPQKQLPGPRNKEEQKRLFLQETQNGKKLYKNEETGKPKGFNGLPTRQQKEIRRDFEKKRPIQEAPKQDAPKPTPEGQRQRYQQKQQYQQHQQKQKQQYQQRQQQYQQPPQQKQNIPDIPGPGPKNKEEQKRLFLRVVENGRRRFHNKEKGADSSFKDLPRRQQKEIRREFEDKYPLPEGKKPDAPKPGWRDRLQDLGDKQGTVVSAYETSYERNKHMLYELTKMAFVRTELRADLVPLVRVAHAARVASHGLDLRGILIRTAYASTNPDLRRVLVAAVVDADKRTPAQIMKHADARAPRKGEYRQAFLRWVNNQKFRNPNPDGRKDSNGQPMDVSFFTLPPPEQSRIYQEWQQGRLDWAQRHKPEGLSEESRITVENFGDLKIGDVVWRSDSPVKLHRITKVDLARPNSPRLTMAQFNRENPDVEGDDRHLSPGAVKNPMLEYHRVPDMGPRADRKRAIARLPQQPRGGWPKFDDLGVGARREEKLQDAFRGMVDVRDPKELSLARVKDRLENALGESPPPRKAVKEFLHNLRDWASELAKAAKEQGDVLGPQHRMYGAMVVKLDQGIAKLEGKDRKERREKKETKSRLTPDMSMLKPHPNRPWDDKQRGKLQNVFGQAFDQVSKGVEVGPDFIEKVLKKAKGAGIDTSGQGGAQVLHVMSQMARQVAAQEGIRSHEKRDLNQAAVQIAGQATKLLHRFHDEKREKEEEKAKRKEEPKRHENRKKLQGGGRKQMDAVAKLNAHFIKMVLPDSLSDRAKVVAKEQLKKAKYGDLEKMRRAAVWLADNWEDDRAKEHPLVKNMGFDREGLQKLQKLMKRKLGDVNGRQYHQDVLEMSNKYDLESEDADALYDFRIDKPTRGRALSDQEKMSRFLAKAKPETKERMQGMSVQDFMVMYNAILQEVLEDEEDLAAAA